MTPPRTGGIGSITANTVTHIDHPDTPVNLGSGAQTFHFTADDRDRLHIEVRDGAIWINGERQG